MTVSGIPPVPAEVQAQIEMNRRASQDALEAQRRYYERERKDAEARAAKEAREHEAHAQELAQKVLADQKAAEEVAKAEARKLFPYTDEAFEAAWPELRTQLAIQQMTSRESRAASPREYQGGIPGGFSESRTPVTPPSQRV